LRSSKFVKAVLTDVQFWIPVGVLLFGLAVLIWLHWSGSTDLVV